MGLFFYTKKDSVISTVDLPTTEIIEPENVEKKGTLKLLALRRLKVSSSQLEFRMGQVPFYF